MGRTMVVAGPFLTRRKARRVERVAQRLLDPEVSGGVFVHGAGVVDVPPWAEGVRVERAGLLQWVVVATSWTGH